jgi:hypothetical protein
MGKFVHLVALKERCWQERKSSSYWEQASHLRKAQMSLFVFLFKIRW